MVILVHGYRPIAEQFDGLEAALASHGFQVLRFNYNWKSNLEESADRFVEFVRAHESQLAKSGSQVTVIAHSMGGLVARRGMIEGRAVSLATDNIGINFISVATPFGGYSSANNTRYIPFNIFGIHASQRDLASRSSFISKPGVLGANVSHTIIATDETGALRCRASICSATDVRALVSDAVALPINQINERVDADPRVNSFYCLHIGHVGVLHTTQGTVPAELIELLLGDSNTTSF